MINKESIRKAYLFLRENNHDIPSEVLDFMLKASTEKLEKLEFDRNCEEAFDQPIISPENRSGIIRSGRICNCQLCRMLR